MNNLSDINKVAEQAQEMLALLQAIKREALVKGHTEIAELAERTKDLAEALLMRGSMLTVED